MSRPVLVVGSLNHDLVMSVERLPRAGETISATALLRGAGGKGANQAAAAGRLGAPTELIGAVGRDDTGDDLIRELQLSGVDTGGVARVEAATGLAAVLVDNDGQNQIAIYPGANAQLTVRHLEAQRERFSRAAVCLLQLEVPLEVVERAAELAQAAGAAVVLDPAPAQDLGSGQFRHIDVITPNETETFALTGVEVHSFSDARRAAAQLVQRGAKTAIIKMGAAGACLFDGDRFVEILAAAVDAVDATAAGDAFNGAFAAALRRGLNVVDAARYANAAAALSVTRRGALSSLPWASEVDDFLRRLDVRS